MSAASPTFQEFLQPGDASPQSATLSSGSSSPEVFFDAADQLPMNRVPPMPAQGGMSEQFHDALETPATSVNVCNDGHWATQDVDTHGHNRTDVTPPYGGYSHTNYTWNEDAGQSHAFFRFQDKPLPQKLPERGIFSVTNGRELSGGSKGGFCATGLDNQKPKARRFLMDFLPQKQTESSLKEETRKIVQMLSNDKTYKIDRPSLGLQDRLQSLVQRSAGKKTTYAKGPRVRSTHVKLIVKRTQDFLHVRRSSFQEYGSKQEDRPPLPVFNKPIQSYSKPPKQRKVSDGSDAPHARNNQVNSASGFEFVIKRRKKDTDNVPSEKTDSKIPAVVSTSTNPPAESSQVTSNISPNLTSTTTDPHTATLTPTVTTQHASHNHLDLSMEEQTVNTYLGRENVHVSSTINMTQDTRDSPRQSLINVELKISVPYRLQDVPDCTDHKSSFLHTLENNEDDDYYEDVCDYDDNDGNQYDAPPGDEMEITSEKCHSTVSCSAEPDEIKIQIREEATVITQDLQTKQDVTSVNFTNGHTEQKKVVSPGSGNKMSPHPSCMPPLSRHQEDSVTNTAVDLREHIASLNKVYLEFGRNKEKKNDNAAVPRDLPASPEQHSTPPAIQYATSNTNRQASRKVEKQNGESVINSSLSHAGAGARFCVTTAIENASLPIYKGGEAMLRPLSHTSTSPLRRISTRDLLYTDEETQQSSTWPQSALRVDTLMRLKTDNLVARHGGKKVHLQPYPPSPRQASPIPDQTPVHEDTTENLPPVESLPPIPPKTKPATVSRQASKEEAEAASPPINQMERRHSSRKASGHWTRSRNASLDHPSRLCSRKGSKRPSFSQDMLRKCLMAAVDQCYNNEWEEPRDTEVVKDDNLSQDELNKSLVKGVLCHDAEKVRVVLKLGADPNVKCGNTPALLRAAREGALYVLQALLTAGADVDARTDLGNSPLHLAARGGYGEAIVQLVHSGAFVDAINRSGVTPLQMALAHGHVEVAQTLLRFNADLFLQNKVGETAYDVAKELGYIGLVSGTPREIRRDSGIGTRVELPSTDIPIAVRMIQGIEIGCAGTVDDCLREGASPNTLLPLALHWPARASVLHRAAHHGHDLIVRLLLAAGADINIRDVVGNTSLHVAAQAGHNRVVKILLEWEAPMEAVSQSGMTPLHRAASKGKELTCNLLIRRGSNLRAEDDSGRTPADWARKRGFKHLSQKLVYRRKSSNTLLAEGDEKQCLEHLHRLHEAALKAPSQSPEPMDCEK
ncbi:uncharacterized protein LOC135112104 [Scylla paramamosain]|uniref:uncharacterized protein LOC135112104 n=1 Tax=Scylla paramamosain TaxID=85552 RepID=UPI0030832757